MTDEIAFFVAGEPQRKERPRFGQGRAFTPRATRDAERAIAWEARFAMRGRRPLEGPVHLTVVAIHGLPRSWSEKRRAAAWWKTSTPDADNVLKLVDACNGIVWADDAQVCVGAFAKIYGDRPGLAIAVRPATAADSAPALLAIERWRKRA